MISILGSLGLASSAFCKGKHLTIVLSIVAIVGILGSAILTVQNVRLETQLGIANKTITQQNKTVNDMLTQIAIHEKAVQQAEVNYALTKNLLDAERIEFSKTKKTLERKLQRWDNVPQGSCSDTMNILRNAAKDGHYVY